MTPADAALWGTFATVVIREIFAGFRRQRLAFLTQQAHTELVTKSDATAVLATEIKQQTNGASDKMQTALTDALLQIGRLQAQMSGLQAARMGGRASDPPVVVVVPPPVPVPVVDTHTTAGTS